MVFVHVVNGGWPVRGVTGLSPGTKGKMHPQGPRESSNQATSTLLVLRDHFIDGLPCGALGTQIGCRGGRGMSYRYNINKSTRTHRIALCSLYS